VGKGTVMADYMPLTCFPPEKQAEIARLVALPKPPPKWLYLGNPEDAHPVVAIISRAWTEWFRQRGRPPGGRESISPSLRRFVIKRDGLVCGICSGAVERSDVHIDHIEPLARGGSTVAGNLRVTHSRCNLRKGAS